MMNLSKLAASALLALMATEWGRADAGSVNSGSEVTGAPADQASFHLFNPTPVSQLRDIYTLYENPFTVNDGHMQVETHVFQYVRDHDTTHGNDREIKRFGPMTLKLGVLNNLDAEGVLSPYTHVRTDERAPGAVVTQEGLGGITRRLKLHLWGDDGGRIAGAIIGYLKLPSSQNDLGNIGIEPGAVLPLAIQLLKDWSLVLSPELDYLRDLNGCGFHVEVANTIYRWHSIAVELSGCADFLTTGSTECCVPWLGIADVGLSYAWSSNGQLDCGLSLGVTRNADNFNLYPELSFRL